MKCQVLYPPSFKVNNRGYNYYKLNDHRTCTYTLIGKNEFRNEISTLMLLSTFKDSGFIIVFGHGGKKEIGNNIDAIERIIDSFRFIS